MAMKVSKSTIHRIEVQMSCGCRMYSEFKDPRYKEPVTTAPIDPTSPAVPQRVFTACSTHAQDGAVSMLEFIIGERLEEAVLDANKAPVFIANNVEEGDSGGVVAVADGVQTMGMKVPQRQKRAPVIKTIQRNPEQLKAAGAVTGLNVAGTGAEMQIDSVDENEAITGVTDEALDFLDSKENGLFEDEEN